MKPELKQNLKTVRYDYSMHQLFEENINSNPIKQFSIWLKDAFDKGDDMANAFSLSTIDEFNFPSSRVLLLRDVEDSGFTFFTNYESHKGQDIERNSNVCSLFFWKELQRQVRIKGTIKHLPTSDSEDYFHSRPRESQLAALSSQQSQVIKNRNVLEERFIELSKFYENKTIPCPQYWGGYILNPIQIEFWQGRESRLHDRIQYTLDNQHWRIERLAP